MSDLIISGQMNLLQEMNGGLDQSLTANVRRKGTFSWFLCRLGFWSDLSWATLA